MWLSEPILKFLWKSPLFEYYVLPLSTIFKKKALSEVIFTERSKITGGVFGFFVLMILIIAIMTMSLCVGIKNNVKKMLFATTNAVEAVADADVNPLRERYSAVLSENSIIIFDAAGKLYREIEVFNEFLTSEDKQILSGGVELYGEEALASFIADFE